MPAPRAAASGSPVTSTLETNNLKRTICLCLMFLGVIFIVENSYLYLCYRFKSYDSGISVARQLHLAILTFHTDHELQPKTYPKSYPKRLDDLVSTGYLTQSHLNHKLPNGYWTYDCPRDDSKSSEIMLTGVFEHCIITCTVGGEIKTTHAIKKFQQDGPPNDPQRGSFKGGQD